MPKDHNARNTVVESSGVQNEPLTMTLPELARHLGYSKNLIYQSAHRGELPVPVIRVGRRLMVSRRAVEELLSHRRQ